MKSLDSIMIAHQSDKASQFSRTYAKPHDYCRHLEPFFEPLRDKLFTLLEIGVGGGESIKAWLEYFESALIFGVDINSNTNEFNTPNAQPKQAIRGELNRYNRYGFIQGHQSDPNFWNSVFNKHILGNVTVIIDDGSHYAIDMKNAFTCLWSHLSAGGLYVIEDLNFDRNSRVWLEGLVAHVHDQTFNIDSIYFARELAILRKK